LGEAGVARRLSEDRAELTRLAQSLSGPNSEVRVRERWQLAGGTAVTFERQGSQWVLLDVPGAIVAATDVAEFARQLGAALGAADSLALLGLLSDSRGQRLEKVRDALARELSEPEGCEVEVRGDHAVIATPSGYVLRLSRVRGSWRLEEVE